MLKHFAAATFGFALLFGAVGPAAAGKSGHYWVGKHPSPYVYSYGAQPRKYVRTGRSQPKFRLDFETEAVWRNLRPNWFD